MQVPATHYRHATRRTKLIGRSRELASLRDQLATEQLVTLLGPPGVGKSRLALELTARRTASSDVQVCDLTEATDAESVSAAVSRRLEVEGATMDIGAALAKRGAMLLVLDNFDRATHAAQATVATWLDSAPELRVLVTSRRRLAIPGEVLFDVEPLALPAIGGDPRESDAYRLFVERARMASRSWTPSADDDLAIAALVRHLDGLPLAIELCAARIRVLAPRALASQLERRLHAVAGPGAANAIGSRTLRDAVESSWSALGDPARRALARMSVFRGSFDLEAAHAVTAPDPSPLDCTWTIDVLQELIDHSLVVATRRGKVARFGLYVSVRELAAEKLAESGDGDAAIMAHARHYLGASEPRARELEGPDVSAALDWLGEEAENLTAVHARAMAGGGALDARDALRAATALAYLLGLRGPPLVGLRLLDEALSASGDTAPDDLLADALVARAFVLGCLGRLNEALAAAEGAKCLGERAGRPISTAFALEQLGRVQQGTFRIRESIASFEAALEVHRHRGDGPAQARLLGRLGGAYVNVEDLPAAKQRLAEGLRILNAAGNRLEAGRLTSRLAMVEAELGDVDTAARRYDDALRLLQVTGDRVCEAMTLICRGVMELERGSVDLARRSFEGALAVCRKMDYRLQQMFAHGYLGACWHELGDVAAAIASFETALRLSDALSDRVRGALLRGCLAVVHAGRDEIACASELLDHADADVASAPGHVLFAAALWIHRGHLDLAHARRAARGGDSAVAATRRRAARDRLERARVLQPPPQAEVRQAIRWLAEALGDEPAALRRRVANQAPSDALRVADNGAWFQPPNGEIVDCLRRGSVRRVLVELAQRRRREPGRPIESHALASAAWPDETLPRGVLANRLRVAIATLRRLGLDGALLTHPTGGYLLDARLTLLLVAHAKERRAR